MLDGIWWWIKLALGLGAMILLVPLMVWGGTSDWRHALHALKSYLKIMGGLVLIAAVAALLIGAVQWLGLH